jgi:hypothetical protein
MWINARIHDRTFPWSERNRAAGACIYAALEYHHAIALLFRERLNAAAFALLRLEVEAYMRGVWLAHCATDAEVDAIIKDAQPPSVDVMLAAIEALPTFSSKVLSGMKDANWQAMCSYTHTGGLQVQRLNTGEGIASRHSVEEIDEVLRAANMFAVLAAMEFCGMADDVALADELLGKMRLISGAATTTPLRK